jgi:hypothetical protein
MAAAAIQLGTWVVAVLVFLPLFRYTEGKRTPVWWVGGFAGAFALWFLPRVQLLKCPRCGKSLRKVLGDSTVGVDRCPHCGVSFDEPVRDPNNPIDLLAR